MQLYCVSIIGYDEYSPNIIYHEDENLDFDKLVKNSFRKMLKKLATSHDKEDNHLLLNEHFITDLVVKDLIQNNGFRRLDICEFQLREFSFFTTLYSRRGDFIEVSKQNQDTFPKWISKKLKQKMLQATEQFVSDDKKL